MIGKVVHMMRVNTRFFLLAAAIFIVSSLIGYLNAEAIQLMAQELLKELAKIAERIQENNSAAYTFWVIFQNNVLASLSMMGLGIFLGIYPILALLSNGILLGFLLKTFALKGVNPFSVLVVGILPHGLIEIFAVILAAAVGMKLGTLIFRFIGNLANTSKRHSIKDEFKESVSTLPYSVGSVVVLLFIAAIIESTVTPMLIQTFLGDLGGLGE